jgi:multidrug efflux system membrane fusion protein
MNHRRAAAIAVAFVAVILASCEAPAPTAAPGVAETRFPVELETVVARDLDHDLTAPASVVPFATVSITARVAGVLDRVLVTEGDHVDAGQVVAEIESDRYHLIRDSAQAALDQAEATERDAAAGAARREDLAKSQSNLVKPEELDQYRARAAEASAAVAVARIALKRAELDLHDAEVASPIAGIIQARMSETGQYAQPGTVIATLVEREPLRLKFAIPVDQANAVSLGQTVTFRVRGADGEATARTATVNHIAAAGDAASRMVDVWALIPPTAATAAASATAAVAAGAFAEVRLTIHTASALVVPEAAIRPSERGFLAYIVDPDHPDRVRERVVEVGARTADAHVAVLSGLNVGERVVVRGNEGLSDGALIREAAPDQGSAEIPSQLPTATAMATIPTNPQAEGPAVGAPPAPARGP